MGLSKTILQFRANFIHPKGQNFGVLASGVCFRAAPLEGRGEGTSLCRPEIAVTLWTDHDTSPIADITFFCGATVPAVGLPFSIAAAD